MFNGQFYYQLNRKYTTLFGTLFNDITFIRYNEAHTQEISRIKVPLEFGNRERFLQRLVDPDFNKSVATQLPRMSFWIAGYEYDASRKINPLLRTPKANNATGVDAGYQGVPYNISFELMIMTRYIDDGDQIVEQILPQFNPDYTFVALPLPSLGLIKDIPVILEDVNQEFQYEDDFTTFKVILWTLRFTMQVYYYPEIIYTKIIRTAFANTFIDPLLETGAIVRVNLSNGNNGAFQLDDTVYQGNTIRTSTAAGIVTRWDSVNDLLEIGAVQGTFTTNSVIRAASTNARYTINTFDATPLKIVSIKTVPDPITANVGDDYGYTQTRIEYPDTENE